MADKKADLAGPGISTYAEVEKILPTDYRPLLDRKETQKALFAVKRYIEDNLCKELNLQMVAGAADRGPGERRQRLPRPRRLAHADRVPLRARAREARSTRRSCRRRPSGRGWRSGSSTARSARASAPTCARCARTTSSTTTTAPTSTSGTGSGSSPPKQRNLDYLKDTVRRIWKVINGAEHARPGACSRSSRTRKYPEPARGADVPARRGDPRHVPGPAAQAARDRRSCRSTRRSSSSASAGC